MYKWEKSLRDDRHRQERKNPSFSSSLLDEIYRSIDDGEADQGELGFYRERVGRKQSNGGGKCNRAVEDEKWMIEKKVGDKVVERRRQSFREFDRKAQYDHDPLFFSSSSSSSDSSCGGFSSSETESAYGVKSGTSCFNSQRPKPVRTQPERMGRTEKTEKREKPLFYEHRELQMLDDYRHNSFINGRESKNEESFIKSKSRALQIYSNLKKMKQPISPGGRLATFINSLFTAGNTKKTKSPSSVGAYDDASSEKKLMSAQESKCSSASSFSRSCLSKTSPSSRRKLSNGVKRSVRFCPVSVIVDEDCRPCGHKCLYEEDSITISRTSATKLGRSPSWRSEQELKFQLTGKSRQVQEAARDILKNYHKILKKNDLVRNEVEDEDDDDDDDAASYSSSDLFELDHLALIGSDRYREELPVYETTHLDTNRAIANGLII